MRNIIAYENNAGKAKVLNTLAKGAKLNSRNDEGLTPLHHLFLKTDEDDYPYISDDLVQALIAKGADINSRDNNGDTPLNLACEHGRVMPATVSILLAAGANPAIPNITGCTPLLTLLRSAPPTVNAVADVLIKAMTPDMLNIQDIRGNTALHYAAEYENTYILIKLLDNNSNINITNNKRQTPIYLSIKINNVDGVFQLLIRRANIKIKDIYGHLPLDDAIQQVLLTNAAKKLARSRNNKREAEERAESALKIKEELRLTMLEEEVGYNNNNNNNGAEFYSR